MSKNTEVPRLREREITALTWLHNFHPSDNFPVHGCISADSACRQTSADLCLKCTCLWSTACNYNFNKKVFDKKTCFPTSQ